MVRDKDVLQGKQDGTPLTQTYQLAAMAKMSRKPMKRKDSMLFADTRSVENTIVLTNCPCAVPNPVRRTIPRQPPSGVVPGIISDHREIGTRTGKPTSIRGLQKLRAAEQHFILVLAISVQLLYTLKQLDRLFQQRRRFSRQHRFVDNATTVYEKYIRRNIRLCLMSPCCCRRLRKSLCTAVKTCLPTDTTSPGRSSSD